MRLAIIPVRDGILPAGAPETVAEAGGRALLIGSGTHTVPPELMGIVDAVITCEAGDFAPSRWARLVADAFDGGRLDPAGMVVLPASPDGRDLAPRIAASLGWPLVPSAIRISESHVDTVACGGRAVELHHVVPGSPYVVTFQPGARSVTADPSAAEPERSVLELPPAEDHASDDSSGDGSAGAASFSGINDPVLTSLLPPDVTTMDLSEAPRLLGGGAGLDSAERFEQLGRIATTLRASMGATRVITDRGWLGHDRQIGTTGVVVDPDLYLALGISGAIQHTAGLGNPEHVISVNTDEHAPMMEMADLAVVADANQVLDHLEALIARGSGGPSVPDPNDAGSDRT